MMIRRRSQRLILVSALALCLPLSTAHLQADEPTGLQTAAALESVLVEAIARAEKSIVAIARVRRTDPDLMVHVERADPFNFRAATVPKPNELDFIPNEYATGVVVDATGRILTANHVLREESDYWVTTADRKTYKAKVVGADPRSDLAVLEIAARDLVPITLGDAAKLKKGQIVIALGNPYAIARDGQASASWGIVANVARKDGPVHDRDSPFDKPTKPALHQYGTLIQTDAKLNLGTSGGALLNLQGEMVGLTLSLAATQGYEQSAGFALPVDDLFRRALESLKHGREVEYGFLGVALEPLTLDEKANGKQGVRVRDIVSGTPAHRSGLAPGFIVTQVDDQPVFDPDQLMLGLGKLPPDAEVRLTVDHDGRVRSVPVQLAKYWVQGKKVVTNRPPAWRGLRVDYLTASPNFQRQAVEFRLDSQGAVLVTEVDENSPAWKEGLRPDMLISHVGSRRVSTPKEFQAAVGESAGPVQIRLNLPAGENPLRTIPADDP